MGLAIRLLAEPVRTTAFGSITGLYAAVGTPFDNPVRIIFIQNLSDETLMFSLDGVHDHFPLPSNGFILLDVTTNKTVPVGCFLSQGTQVYVKEFIASPSAGAVYVSVFYGDEQ